VSINHRVHLVCDQCDEMEIKFGASSVDDLDMLDVEPGDDCLNCGGTLVRKSEVSKTTPGDKE